jgi:hypothetical protein
MAGMIIHQEVIQRISLSAKEVNEIFRRHLEELKGGRWVEGNKLKEEHVTSHRFDAEIGDKTHPDFLLVKTIQDLEKILKEKKIIQ